MGWAGQKSPKIYSDVINGWSPGGGVLTLVSKVLKYCGNTMLKSCGCHYVKNEPLKNNLRTRNGILFPKLF